MKNYTKLFLSASLFLVCFSLKAQTSQTNKAQEVVNAVERVYNESLQEDKTNYNAYFRRAYHEFCSPTFSDTPRASLLSLQSE